jgi:hypothetical protein
MNRISISMNNTSMPHTHACWNKSIHGKERSMSIVKSYGAHHIHWMQQIVTTKRKKRYHKECCNLHWSQERVGEILDTTTKLYWNCGKACNSLSPIDNLGINYNEMKPRQDENPLGWPGHYKEFKLEWQSHSWLPTTKRDVGIKMFAPRMISMQIAKLCIATNLLCSTNDV